MWSDVWIQGYIVGNSPCCLDFFILNWGIGMDSCRWRFWWLGPVLSFPECSESYSWKSCLTKLFLCHQEYLLNLSYQTCSLSVVTSSAQWQWDIGDIVFAIYHLWTVVYGLYHITQVRLGPQNLTKHTFIQLCTIAWS